MRDPQLNSLFSIRGATTRVARHLGISTAAVSQWDRVPTGRVEQVAEALGVTPDEVRPDLYPSRDAA